MTEGYAIQPGQAEKRWFFETATHFLADGESTGGEFCLVEEEATKGEGPPLHRHADDMESFYVLEGELTIFVGDGPGARAPAGSFAHVPAGEVHGFRVESEHARYLILTTPHHGDFYRAITLASGPEGEPPSEPIDGAKVGEAARKYGIERVGPLPD